MTVINGGIPNGDICSSIPDIPTVEVSPSVTPPGSDDNGTPREASLTPPANGARSAVTPGRRAMEALKEVWLSQGSGNPNRAHLNSPKTVIFEEKWLCWVEFQPTTHVPYSLHQLGY